MIQCKINNIAYEFKPNITIMQACSSLNIDIPRFCFHERLSIAGNCRMCLVEVRMNNNVLKPTASCAMPLTNGMEIFTNTLLVKRAREGVLEFLLANHPLDCPICDQGSECDLQDQAMVYGTDRGRFYEVKRSVEDKDCGPLIKTIMTRCIHCTRCIRFTTEIAGTPVFGLTGRGAHMEVGTYVDNVINSELSGNIIDLCPVGALTSKPFAFTARAWELNGVDSIDVFDALGSNIKFDCRGAEIMRVLPRINELVNEEWISDKVRFAYDGFKLQRLITPMIQNSGSFVDCSWVDSLKFIKTNLKNIVSSKGSIHGFVGDTVDLDAMLVLKDFLVSIDSKAALSIKHVGSFDFRSDYLFNMSLENLNNVDLCLIIGSNSKLDAPVLNARFRKYFLQNNVVVANIGSTINLTYDYYHLGNELGILLDIFEGSHWFCNQLIKSKSPLIIIGSSILDLKSGVNILNLFKIWLDVFKLVNKNIQISNLNTLPTAASYVGALDLGFNTNNLNLNLNSTRRFIYALDTLEPLKIKKEGDFIVYQGHHGNSLLFNADVILPGSTFSEKDGYYTNLLGMVQKGRFVSKPPGIAREDWKILAFLYLGILKNFRLNNINLDKSVVLYNLYKTNISFKVKFIRKRLVSLIPFIELSSALILHRLNIINNYKSIVVINNNPLFLTVQNYYRTDSITEASLIMTACVEKFVLGSSNYLKIN
jgi:NADH-quinone oxidoreductase chain G